MGKIKDLPPLDRPREKAKRYGLNSLSDVELLALLIGNGYEGSSANDIANELLSHAGGLVNLSKIPNNEYTKTKGIKSVKALTLAAIFELHRRLSTKEIEQEEIDASESYLYNKYKVKVANSNQENLFLVVTNSRNKIIHEKLLYSGTENNIIFSYKDIWREVFTHNGKGFYLIHNHPSGDSTPSQKDMIYTQEILRESRRLETPLLDHLIIGRDNYSSMKSKFSS